MRTRYALLCLGLCGALYSAGSNATGVSQYRYDALGRLTQVCTSTASSGARTDYTHDKADNRQNVRSQSATVSLPAGSNLYSPNGQYFLAMQGDGNFVLYGPSGAKWSSNTQGSGANLAAFQSDGNLVVYGPSGAVWHAGTYGNYCANLAIQDDGNVVIYSAAGPSVWATNTVGP